MQECYKENSLWACHEYISYWGSLGDNEDVWGTSGQVADAKEISPVGNTGQHWSKVGNSDAVLMHVTRQFCPSGNKSSLFFPSQISPTHLIDSAVQERTSLRDIFFLKSPFFWMLRLLAAKFSRSVRVPADSVEWMLAETERVEPERQKT